MTAPGRTVTRSHSSSGEQSGVKAVVADSGRTTSSAPVSLTQRVSQSTHFSMLALTTSGLSGPGTGAIWMAAAVKARMSSPPGNDAHSHAGQSDRSTGQRAVEEVPALERRAGTCCCSGIRRPGTLGSGIRHPGTLRSDGHPEAGSLLGNDGGADAGDVGIDRSEELAGHLLGDTGEHPLPDATDAATDDGIGVVSQVSATGRGLLKAERDVGADRPRCPGAGSLENKRTWGVLLDQGDLALVGAPDRGNTCCDGHAIRVRAHLAQLLTPRERAGKDGRVIERSPDLLDRGVE